MYSTIHCLVLRTRWRRRYAFSRQRRRDQIQEVIAGDVAVFLVVGEELLEGRFAVQRVETLDIERIAHPVDGRRLPQHRSPAAVLHAADDLVDGDRSWARRDPLPCRSRRIASRVPDIRVVGIDRPMRLKSCRPSP